MIITNLMQTNLIHHSHMMKKSIVLFILLLTFWANSGSTQEKILTLREAISFAGQNNSDLVKAKIDLMIAKTQVSEAYADNLIPSITLTSNYTRNFKKQVFNIFGENVEIGSDNSITNTIYMQESIPILGTPVFQGIRIAEYYEKLNAETVSSVEAAVKQNVTEAYLNVLFAKEILEVNLERMDHSSENFAVVEARYRNGVATEFDYLRARVTMENIAPTIDKSESDLEVSKLFLKQVIGDKSDQKIEVTGRLTYDSLEVLMPADDIVNRIVQNNVAVRQLNITRQINSELNSVEEKTLLPKLYLFGQYQLGTNENDDRSISEYRWYNTLSAGINLSWDLNFFRKGHAIDRTELEIRKTEENIADVKRKLRTQAQSVILNMEDARNRIIAQRENIALAERSLDLANISFKNGTATQLDVLNTELTLSETRLSYLQSIYDFLVAKSKLEELLEQ
jgi:outer membrane protein